MIEHLICYVSFHLKNYKYSTKLRLIYNVYNANSN